jgi:hypothetical protein
MHLLIVFLVCLWLAETILAFKTQAREENDSFDDSSPNVANSLVLEPKCESSKNEYSSSL